MERDEACHLGLSFEFTLFSGVSFDSCHVKKCVGVCLREFFVFLMIDCSSLFVYGCCLN